MLRLATEQQPETEDFAKDLSDKHIVFDGGALLQQIPLEKKNQRMIVSARSTLTTLHRNTGYKGHRWFSMYTIQHHQSKTSPIWDGKGRDRTRRSIFNRNMVCSTKKEVFLSNFKNKQAIIAVTSEYLTKAGCQVYQAEGDADPLIVLTAVQSTFSYAYCLGWRRHISAYTPVLSRTDR